MNKNENGGLDLKSTPETTDLQELIKGCNQAIITHALEECIYAPNGFKARKMVVFFEGDGFCHETVNNGINDIMIQHCKSLVKSHFFIIQAGETWKKSLFRFAAYLLRPILGISANEEIIDITDRKIEYKKKGGTHGKI